MSTALHFDDLRPALAYVNNRPERASRPPERWVVHWRDRSIAVYLVHCEIGSGGDFQPFVIRIRELTVPYVVTVTSEAPHEESQPLLEWLHQ
jgi:hypothetical protein